MSTFAEKKALKAQIASAKKAGKSTQTIGRLQYKLNNLAADPKGNAVRTKAGVVKTSNGDLVRTKPNPNKTTGKRIISKGTAKAGTGHPSGGTAPKKKPTVTPTVTKKAPTKKVVNAGSPHRGNNAGTLNPNLGGSVVKKRNDKKSNVTVTPYPASNVKKVRSTQPFGKKVDVSKGGSVVKKRNPNGNLILHPYTKLTDAQLKSKVRRTGDEKAKAILKIRSGK